MLALAVTLLAPAACWQARAGAAADERPAPNAALRPTAERTLYGGLTVRVTADQRVTVVGEAESRRAVIDAICEMAGIELRNYTALEGGYVGRLENVSIDDAFRRILRSESYILGVKATAESGSARVTWIRVLGDERTSAINVGSSTATASAAPGEPPAEGESIGEVKPKPPFALAASVLAPAFVSANPDLRLEAQRALVTRLSDPETAAAFVAADIKPLVEQIGRYRDPMHGLAELQSLTENAAVRAKLAEILEGVREFDRQRLAP